MKNEKTQGIADAQNQLKIARDLAFQRQTFDLSCADRVDEIEKVFRFSLDDLEKIDRGDSAKHPVDFGQELRFVLKDGREIFLTELYQYRTYEGYLSGLPHPYVAFRQAIDVLRAKFEGFDAQPIVLPPVAYAGVFAEGILRFNWMTVPLVCSIACFSSNSPVSDLSKTRSDALVLWFQDSFGLERDERTVTQFLAIDWNSGAVDWDY